MARDPWLVKDKHAAKPQLTNYSRLLTPLLIGLTRMLQWLIEHSPVWVGRFVISSVGSICWLLFPFSRKAVDENLKAAGGGSSRGVFVNFAQTFSHFLSCRDPAGRPRLSVENEDILRHTFAQGRGVILVTAHLGNWELGVYQLSEWRLPTTVVYQPYQNHAVNNFINSHRASGVRWAAVSQGATKAVLSALKNKEIVVLMGDTPFGEEGHHVEFLGKKLCMGRGPAVLSVKSGAPIVPVFIVQERHAYKALFQESLWPQGQTAEDLLHHFKSVLEKVVKSYPVQWYLFQRFWS